jgi:hypothetical protein
LINKNHAAIIKGTPKKGKNKAIAPILDSFISNLSRICCTMMFPRIPLNLENGTEKTE